MKKFIFLFLVFADCMGMHEQTIYAPRARHIVEEISDDEGIDWKLDDGSLWNKTLAFDKGKEVESGESEPFVSPWESFWKFSEESADNHRLTPRNYRHSPELIITRSDMLKIMGNIAFKGLFVAGIGFGLIYLFLKNFKHLATL